MKQKAPSLILLLLSAFLLFACQDDQALETPDSSSGSSPSETEISNNNDPAATPVINEQTEAASSEQQIEGEELSPAADLPDLEGREVRVAVENAYLPFNFISLETGQADGWDYAVIGEICERLNCTPVWIELSWDKTLVAVRSGDVDMVGGGVTITEARTREVVFSVGCISVEQRLLARSGEDRFEDAAEFAADPTLILGVFEYVGDANYPTAVDLVGEERLQTYENFTAAQEALLTGAVDALIIDDVADVIELDSTEEMIVVGQSLATAELAFAFAPESEFIEPFNAAITLMVAEGSLAEHNQNWFGPTFDMSYDNIDAGAYLDP